jgi:hypothetical protein
LETGAGNGSINKVLEYINALRFRKTCIRLVLRRKTDEKGKKEKKEKVDGWIYGLMEK